MSEHKKDHRPHGMMDDELADEQPIVLESSQSDPIFPAMSEFEVDTGGPKGTHDPTSGLIWAVIAIGAVVVLCVYLISIGDWA